MCGATQATAALMPAGAVMFCVDAAGCIRRAAAVTAAALTELGGSSSETDAVASWGPG